MRRLVRTTITIAILGLVSTAILSAMAQRVDSSTIKELMGDNFAHMQVILVNLVRARYDEMPAEIATIRDHAAELPKNIPSAAKTDFERKTFTNYAYQLENTANNMLIVLQELRKRDRAAGGAGELPIDYLRVVAARHFGEIITTCVLCHNQFRRHSLD